MPGFYQTVLNLLEQGRSIAVATLIETKGSTPQTSGGKMIIAGDGETFFSIGGGALEASVIAEAKRCIAEGRRALKSYALNDVGDDALGMACGGKATVFIDPVHPPDRLVVFGAGHVGRALCRLAEGFGFRFDVVDDRADMLDPGAFPEGTRFFATDRSFRKGLPTLGPDAWVVLVTRCHDTDEAALRVIGREPCAYLGMIGSKRKVRVVFDTLEKEGFERDVLDRVHAPIGLPIGSHMPEEVALSILAEIVAVRNRATPPGSSA